MVGCSAALLLLTSSNNSNGNALVISGLTVDQAAKTVTFNLEWDNSWRTINNPFNWDAAWVFCKFRQCGAAPSTDWSHGMMSTALGDHTFPANFEPTTSDGVTIPGIDASPNNTGVMLRRSVAGVYPGVAATSVTLNVTNIPAVVVGIEYDVKVFGIEMVFVPTGSFFLGDGGIYPNPIGNSGWEINTLGSVTAGALTPAYNITSEAGFSMLSGMSSSTVGAAPYVVCANNNVALAAGFPKGYQAFYCMKYEISSEQYAEFLNTITANAGTALFPGSYNTYRNRLNNTGIAPSIYVTDRPNRAQNFLWWKNLSSYLDWACLRPMSELEYEKACRGQGPAIDNEYSWGNNTIIPNTNQSMVISTTIPSEDGTELVIGPVNSNANTWYCVVSTAVGYTGGDAGLGNNIGDRGPLRVGIFADILDNTRMLSGASYYGIMELTGNLAEYVVPATGFYNNTCYLPQSMPGGPSGNTLMTFIRTWGDGYVDVNTGIHNVMTGTGTNGWPPANFLAGGGGGYGTCATAQPASCGYLGTRGGGWDNTWQELRVSDRYYVQNISSMTNNRSGGRGVR